MPELLFVVDLLQTCLTGAMKHPEFAKTTSLPLWFAAAIFCICFSFWKTRQGAPVVYPMTPEQNLSYAARSIWEHGSLEPSEFKLIARILKERSVIENITYEQDIFSVGRGQKLYPKQPYIYAVLAAPFYGIFGEAGFWIFIEIVAFLLLFSWYSLIRHFGHGHLSASLITVAFLLATEFLEVASHFSYDAFGALLVVGGFALAPYSAFLSAVVIGLSSFARITNLTFLPFALWFVLTLPEEKGDSRVRFLSGILLSIGVLLFLNWILWENPISTSYNRIPVFERGAIVIDPANHNRLFTFQELTRNWRTKLFGSQSGIFVWNPLLLFSLLNWICLKGWKNSRMTPMVVGGFFYIILMFSYESWHFTGSGNRFALPGTLLCCLACSLCVPVSTRFSGRSDNTASKNGSRD